MRRLFFLLALFFVFDATLAQENDFKKIRLGFEAGLNNSQQQLRKYDQVATMRSGLRAGISFEKPATKRLAFISTFSYVQAGAKQVRFSYDDERLNYAELSIKAVEYLPLGGGDMFLSLGPYFSYGINGNITNSNGVLVTSNPFNEDEYQRFEWGFGGNFGYKTVWGTYLQFGMQTAFNNFYEMQQSKFFHFALMITAGHTIGWRNFKTYKRRD
jgi:hypothetical protein